MMNHAVDRTWCEVCVRGSGKEMDYNRDGGKIGYFLSIRWIIAFLAMSLVISGPF